MKHRHGGVCVRSFLKNFSFFALGGLARTELASRASMAFFTGDVNESMLK